jgi:hypothetical protein
MGDGPGKSNIMLPVVVFMVMMMAVAAHQQVLGAVTGEWLEACLLISCLLCLPEQLAGCLTALTCICRLLDR